MEKNKTLKLAICAIFVAFTAICSQIQIPLFMIPVNLATFSVYMTGVIMGEKYGAMSMAVYVLLGAVGVPVFAGFKGGLAAVTGATGGYIVGYIACAWTVGMITKHTRGKVYQLAGAMTVGMILCYISGTVWFMVISGFSVKKALIYCVIPFLPGDIVKIIMASVISVKLRNRITNIYELNV